MVTSECFSERLCWCLYDGVIWQQLVLLSYSYIHGMSCKSWPLNFLLPSWYLLAKKTHIQWNLNTTLIFSIFGNWCSNNSEAVYWGLTFVDLKMILKLVMPQWYFANIYFPFLFLSYFFMPNFSWSIDTCFLFLVDYIGNFQFVDIPSGFFLWSDFFLLPFLYK